MFSSSKTQLDYFFSLYNMPVTKMIELQDRIYEVTNRLKMEKTRPFLDRLTSAEVE